MSTWQGSTSGVAAAGIGVIRTKRRYVIACENGLAVASAVNTLEDTGKTWTVNGWSATGTADAATVTIVSGTGAGQTRTISTNDADTLDITPNWDVVPGVDSAYVIQKNMGWFWHEPIDSGTETTGGSTTVVTDSSKAWTVNQWAGHLVRIRTGNGAGQARRIQSNTATALTTTAINALFSDPGNFGDAPAIGNTFSIYRPIYGHVVTSYSVTLSAANALAVGATIRSRIDASGTLADRIIAVVPSIVGISSAQSQVRAIGYPNGNIELLMGATGAGSGACAAAGEWRDTKLYTGV